MNAERLREWELQRNHVVFIRSQGEHWPHEFRVGELLDGLKAADAALEQVRREGDAAGYRRGVEVMLEAAIDEAVNACGFEQRVRVRAARLLSESKEVPK